MKEQNATWSPEGLSPAQRKLVSVPLAKGSKLNLQALLDHVLDLVRDLARKADNPLRMAEDLVPFDPEKSRIPDNSLEEIVQALVQHEQIFRIRSMLRHQQVANQPAKASNPEPASSLEEWLIALDQAKSE